MIIEKSDTYTIYQLKQNDNGHYLRFMNNDWLETKGIKPELTDYDRVYSGTLTITGDTVAKLDKLYMMFNIDHPVDFKGHSLSVSDIIALRHDCKVSYYYVDSIGFRKLNIHKTKVRSNAEMEL